jgi:DNA repair exonuclease SbcCD ATPase subunit
MVSIGPQLEEADTLLNSSAQDYASLQGIEALARGYGEALLEGFRRGLWKLRRAKRLERTKQEIALLRAQERRARKGWADTTADNTGIQWPLSTDLSDDEDDSPGASSVNGDSLSFADDGTVSRKAIEKYIVTLSKSPLFTVTAENLKEHLSILLASLQSAQIEVGTSPLQSSDNELPSVKTREGSGIYEQLLQDKARAEEKARNFESRVKNLEEMLHRQFRTPPRNFSPIPVLNSSASPSPQPRSDGTFEEPMLGRSIHALSLDAQKRIAELEKERDILAARLGDVEGTKNDLMANLEEQTKLFQLEREDLLAKQHDLERELEGRDGEIERVEKMEEEMDALRKGRQTILREMNLLQTETGAKIRELEDAKWKAEERVTALETNQQTAVAETERITGELRKASVAADDAIVELEKVRRMSDEHKAEREKLEAVVDELQEAKGIISAFEAERTTIQEANLAALNAVREELSSLRDCIVSTLGLEKRRWETESLIHAIRQKAASKDQHASEVSPSKAISLTDRTTQRSRP